MGEHKLLFSSRPPHLLLFCSRLLTCHYLNRPEVVLPHASGFTMGNHFCPVCYRGPRIPACRVLRWPALLTVFTVSQPHCHQSKWRNGSLPHSVSLFVTLTGKWDWISLYLPKSPDKAPLFCPQLQDRTNPERHTRVFSIPVSPSPPILADSPSAAKWTIILASPLIIKHSNTWDNDDYQRVAQG